MQHHLEREFRFDARESALLRLPGVLATLGWPVRETGVRRVRDRYYDTASFRLYAAGVACRVRRCGREQEATLKTVTPPADDGESVRLEVSERLGAAGDASLRAGRSRLGRMLREVLAGEALREVATIVQKRRQFELVAPTGGHVQVSADRVRAAPGAHGRRGAGAVWCAIEVELLEGEPDAARAVADRVRRRLRAPLSRRSKLETALRAADVVLPTPPDLAGARLRADDRVRESGYRVLRLQLARVRWYEPGVRLGFDAEALHEMRVAVRRLRAGMRVFGAALPGAEGASLQRDLRWLATAMGVARDWDVHGEWLERYAAGDASRAKALAAYRRWVQAQGTAARAALARALASARCRRFVTRAAAFVERAAAPGGCAALAAGDRRIGRVAPSWVAEAWDQALAACGRAMPPRGAARLHRLRIRCKRLRDVCEALGGPGGGPLRRVVRRTVAIQDLLGDYHDAYMARRHARAFLRGRPGAAAAVRRWIEYLDETMLARLQALPAAWARFDRAKLRARARKAVRTL